MACRPCLAPRSRPRLRPLLALLAALGLGTACGKGAPKFERRTADEWAELLWVGHDETVMKASESLVTLADTQPGPVIAALERQLLRPPPTPEGVAFTIALDGAGARRLGLSERPAADVVGVQLRHVRTRLEAGGDTRASIRGTADGQIELMLEGAHTRAQAERVQRRLAARGALDLRVVAVDPATARGPAAATAYDGPVAYGTLLETEARRWVEAAQAGLPYRPQDARWLPTPREGRPVGELVAADFVLLREPAAGAAVVDETWFSSFRPETSGDGVAGLRLGVRLEKASAWAEFVKAAAGGRFAVVVDGRVRAELPVPDAAGTGLWVAMPRLEVPAATHAEALEDLAISLSSGRLPWPMLPLPLPKEYGRDPLPGNPISKTIAVIGSPAIPALERVRDGNGPAWGKASAIWALEQISLIEGQGAPPPK